MPCLVSSQVDLFQELGVESTPLTVAKRLCHASITGDNVHPFICVAFTFLSQLNGNLLESLPVDIFRSSALTEMCVLTHVEMLTACSYLNDNLLKALDPHTFARTSELRILYAHFAWLMHLTLCAEI